MAYTDRVNLSDFGDYILKMLDEFDGDVQKAVQETCDESIKLAKENIIKNLEELKTGGVSESNRFNKHYRDTFTYRKKSRLSRVLWNKQYQLSHLLENGHYVYNQYGGLYNIHPEPMLFGYKKDKTPIMYGSKYGTSGKITHQFKAWQKTEDYLADTVEKLLEQKLM